jgi:hypothetical protein
MRNFYNQPTSKIFDKMFGKGARQIQADPTLDITQCKCCDCKGVLTCKGCMQGVTMGLDAGCCPSKDEALIFEYARLGSSSNRTCCNFNSTRYSCCSEGKIAASNVRYSYHYVGKFFRIDYAATGSPYRNRSTSGPVYGWPQNNLPRLCSYCDPLSHNERNNSSQDPPNCTCMDYADGEAIDDSPFGPCTIQSGGCIAPFVDCFCMGSGVFKNTDREGQRLSRYRKKQMEREPYYRWLLDIMCYDEGNVFKNPWFTVDPTTGLQQRDFNGTLYNHLVGVVHCEHWWEIDRCPQNPNVDFAADGFTNINSSCLVPRFWIQACSGVPLFDFEFVDAVEKGYIAPGDLNEIWSAVGNEQTPAQDIMNRMSEGGYFETGDWRQTALDEIKNLQGRTYTKDEYSGLNLPSCSDLKYLGPVRKKYFNYSTNVPGAPPGYPAFLNPKNARPNIVNSNPVEQLESLQLPTQYLLDPWNGQYPLPTNPQSNPQQIEEYNDFVAWKDSQWVYMHARPGGWDYVCAGYYDGTEDVKIPDLPRRFMNDIITCEDPEAPSVITQDTFGGCLTGILGVPQRSFSNDCQSGPPNECPSATRLPCGDVACLGVECADEIKCQSYAEQGGGSSPCGAVMVESNCEGMFFAFSRQGARSCGLDRVDDWPTTREGRAWLYKVNITTGEYSSFCPHVCRSLSIPKPVSTDFEIVFKKKPAHKNLCQNYYHGPNESYLPCPNLDIPDGKYCFYTGDCVEYGNDGEVCSEYVTNCPGQFCFSSGNNPPYVWGPEPECCTKDPGGQIQPNAPVNPTHPAFNNPSCNSCGPGGGEGGIYGPDGCPSLGCCWDCCSPSNPPTLVTQSQCYAGRDPNDPQYAHIIWQPNTNGIDCQNNPSPCASSYPACP